MIDVCEHINSFFKTKIRTVDIYNEISLQHEMGCFLRNSMPGYDVQFERNKTFFNISEKLSKSEIDISIFNSDKSEKYAIELKYPNNGQYPEQMFKFVQDIKFMEELKKGGFTNTFCVVLVSDINFCSGREQNGIYKYFRREYSVYGVIHKPTGNNKDKFYSLDGTYNFTWNDIADKKEKYYVIKI